MCLVAVVSTISTAAARDAIDNGTIIPIPTPLADVAHLGRFQSISALGCHTVSPAAPAGGQHGLTVLLPGAAAAVWVPRGKQTCDAPVTDVVAFVAF